MTIIEPHKNQYPYKIFLRIGSLLILFAGLSIYFYNLNVNLKYVISLHEKTIQELEAANADIRNQIYEMLDPQNLTSLIEKYNLIQDKNPNYLERETLARS